MFLSYRKITDEANPNVFGYSVKILGQDFIGGKIQPRKVHFNNNKANREITKRIIRKRKERWEKVA